MTVALEGSVRHPKIYAYTIDRYRDTPWVGGRTGRGLVKVGQTELDVHRRIREQLNAVKMPVETTAELLLVEAAITLDGRVFSDRNVHAALRRAGYHNIAGEWFECSSDEVKAAIEAVRRGERLPSVRPLRDFPMRPEQQRAVDETAAYFRANPKSTSGGVAPGFLWNAKMRFGKTFATYQLARKMEWTRILVLTYKPAVEKSWRDDLSHVDFRNWHFHGKKDEPPDVDAPGPLVWFASFQDVLGKGDDGGPKAKNLDLYRVKWDVVVVDEFHFGAWRDAARAIYLGEEDEVTREKTEGDKSEAEDAATPDVDEVQADDIKDAVSKSFTVDHYLFLSGTPFRALTEGEFLEGQVYNWTYSDEQRAKLTWKDDKNPYLSLPRMTLLAYEMPPRLRDVALNNLSEFSLTEFFRTTTDDDEPKFVHENEVQQWLDLLRGQDLEEHWEAVSSANRPPMPYANTSLLTALQHTVWYLPGVNACYAMRDLLHRPHNTFFRDYTVVVAAGTSAGMGQEALGPVEAAITRVPQDAKTITLSCGKLMTGVTVPAWAGILMLRELSRPETYFQAAFRVQSPWSYRRVDVEQGGDEEVVVKENCYVIDFSPNRALRLMAEYATKLRAVAVTENDTEAALAEFIEFLPVLAFDGSTMTAVEAGDVIDYLTRGISSSMLARRWNSTELVTLDEAAMLAILDDQELLDGLERIELFRNITDDLTAIISANEELKPKKVAKERLTPEEKELDKKRKQQRNDIRAKLRRFLTRIPTFLYLTDDREKTVLDIIRQHETELFEKVTTLSLRDFERLVQAGAFNSAKMDDAVWKFRQFEEPSLSYTGTPDAAVRGGWNIRRDERFAELLERGLLRAGDELVHDDPIDSTVATVSGDYGILVGGVRYESPDLAAAAADGADRTDGWTYWMLRREGRIEGTLDELRRTARRQLPADA